MANLSNFVGALKDGGSRANQFEVQITGAPSAAQSELTSGDFRFLCQGASVPALTLGEVTVPYRGRQVFVAGDRTYDAWPITVISDTNQKMRAAFEIWQNFIGDIGGVSAGNAGSGAPSDYYASATIMQKDRNDQTLRSLHLYDVWPVSVDAMEFSHTTDADIMTFGVSLRFNYMTVSGAGSSASDASASFSATITIPIG